MSDSYATWQKQRDFLNREREKDPSLFSRATILDTNDILERIGITVFPSDRPAVYLRLWPQDFIVEEITKDGQSHTIEHANDRFPSEQEGQTVYADLVKIGISTLDAIDELEKNFGFERRYIGYAGIKDRDALTSQWLSFRGVAPERVEKVMAPNFFLKNIRQGKGALQIGDLSGNRFTIVVRAREGFDLDKIRVALRELQSAGFWNFFYTQRFGTPRLISHYLGLLVLKGYYEEALKALLTFESAAEIGYYRELRKKVLHSWGDWPTIASLLEPLNYSFRRELILLNHLRDRPSDFLGAFKLIHDQIQLWIFAYSSYLFNRKLSMLIKGGEAPVELPLVLSRNPNGWLVYRELLLADDLRLPSPAFRDFPSIQLKERWVSTRQQFELHDLKIAPEMPKVLVISFTLPKGSYATTLLAHLFTLSGNIPVLSGIPTDQVDSKAILGNGTVVPVVEIFKGVINSKLEVGEELSGEETVG